jgi:hypothetical protein
VLATSDVIVVSFGLQLERYRWHAAEGVSQQYHANVGDLTVAAVVSLSLSQRSFVEHPFYIVATELNRKQMLHGVTHTACLLTAFPDRFMYSIAFPA